VQTSHTGVATALQLNRPERLNAINDVMVGEPQQDARCPWARTSSVNEPSVMTGAGARILLGNRHCRDFRAREIPDASGAPSDRPPPALPGDDGRTAAGDPRHIPAAGDRGGQRSLRRRGFGAVLGPPISESASTTGEQIRATGRSSLACPAPKMGDGATSLPRVVGTSVAADWMLTGRTVSAEEADRRGLVSERIRRAPGGSSTRALEIASRIAEHALR